ncbi:hypothetical protein JL720_10123 [Aureococcus anophagefferens]|nr:hypothetical protein JL720_10123 [Aureococcus anophagefferens]
MYSSNDRLKGGRAVCGSPSSRFSQSFSAARNHREFFSEPRAVPKAAVCHALLQDKILAAVPVAVEEGEIKK